MVEMPAPTLRSAIVCADASTSFELDRQCMDRLNRFLRRTVFTLGNAVMVNLYANEIVKLAYSVGSRLEQTSLTISP